jgi:DNA-binding NtrC family response regulator
MISIPSRCRGDQGAAAAGAPRRSAVPRRRGGRAAIKQTLALTGGMKVQAAQALGIAVSTLYDKLKKYEL